MNKPKVYITRKIPKEVEDYIGKYCDYEKWDWDKEGPIPRNKLLENIRDAEGLLLYGNKIDEELLNNAPKLKVVSSVSVGYNNFDINAMKARKIIGTHTPEVLDDSVADLIIALMLSTARRIPELNTYVKKGKWKSGDNEYFYGLDVHNATVGIIGMGRIGEKVAKRSKLGFNMNVLYYNRNRKYEVEESLGVKYSDFENLLKESDFIVLMTPLNDSTYHLIDSKEFDLMKESAIFINVSRGRTVNERALIEALKNRKIFGAGLDVFDKEPINSDNPLLQMPNVVTVPHIGTATERTQYDMAMLAATNLVKALYGEKPPSVVPELDETKK